MPRYLVTSALPYINGIKHLGNLIGSLLPADVYSRHLRQEGEEVLFICGTDEHGTPAEIAASEKDLPVEKFCQSMYETQKKIYEDFRISFDYFGRSSAPENHEITQEIFLALDKNDFIEEREIKQIYSVEDQRFLPDRYVVGTCPHCQYTKARGDQCESCGRLLNTTDLIDPHSAISGSHQLEVRASKHLFLKLSALESEVREWVNHHPQWPTVTKGIAKKWLTEGLQTRCITRDLKWGVQVPKKGFEDKVFYVWFDAPMAYIAMTKAWAKLKNQEDLWERWWRKDSSEVVYVQFMAKDNVPFHAIFWPAMLIGSRQPWKLADDIKSFSWLNYEGGKFSTSQRRGVFTDQALALFPADYWRYYLLSISPEDADSDFTFDDFARVVNKDLADVLGNFINRVTALVQKYFEGKVPQKSGEIVFPELEKNTEELLTKMDHSLRNMEFRQAAQELRALWSLGNEFITREQPWKVIKEDKEKAAATLNFCLHLIRIYAVASSAFIPTTAEVLFEILGESQDPATLSFKEALNFQCLTGGQLLQPQGNLFNKIPEEEVLVLKEKFSGSLP